MQIKKLETKPELDNFFTGKNIFDQFVIKFNQHESEFI